MSTTKEKVLVVGGAGYIGGITCDCLRRDGFDVAVYDTLLYENRFLKDIPFFHGDVRDTEKLKTVAEDFDVVVLMAALVGDPACNINPTLTEEINHQAIKRFCESVTPGKHIIFMSTCSVYGAQEGILNEESPVNPLSSYASTKLVAEDYIRKHSHTIFRLGTVFGLGDEHSRIRMDLVVNLLTMRAVGLGELTIYGGDQWRPIIAVRDIAEYVVEACRDRHNGTFCLLKENVNIRELGEKVSKLVPGTKIKYTEISFQDARNYRVDNSKSMKVFKYRPVVTVEDEVERMIKIFREKRIENPEDKLYNNSAFLRSKSEQNKFI